MMLEWKNKRRKVITLSAFEGQDEDRSARADSAQEGADSAGTAGGGSGDSCALSKAEAVALAETGLFAEALRLFRLADQTDSQVHEMRAQCLLALNHPFAAVRAADLAAELSPCWAVAHLTLARCQRELGEVALAVASYSAAVDLDPHCRECAAELSEAKELLARLESIHADRTRGLSGLSPEEREAATCALHLQSRASVTGAEPDADLTRKQSP